MMNSPGSGGDGDMEQDMETATSPSRKRSLESEDQYEDNNGSQDSVSLFSFTSGHSGVSSSFDYVSRRLVKIQKTEDEDELRELFSTTMSNDLVMKAIAKKLTAGHLLNLRQTCTIWNRIFIPVLKRKHKERWLAFGEDGVVMDRFVKVVRSSQEFPITRYHFGSPVAGRHCKFFQKFTADFGKMLTSITIYLGRDTNVSLTDLRKIVFDMTPEVVEVKLRTSLTNANSGVEAEELSPRHMKILPKLKQIQAAVGIEAEEPGGPGATPFIELITDIVQCSSGLQNLELYDGSKDDLSSNFTGATLTSLLDISVTHVHKLKTLEIDWLKTTDFQILIELAKRSHNSLQLESFCAQFDFTEERGDQRRIVRLLEEFLVTQIQTLKSLTLNFGFVDDHVEFPTYRIPAMEQLKCFKIEHFGPTPYKLVFKKQTVSSKSVNFMEAFPELKKFSYRSDPNFSVGTKRFFHPGVTDLEMETVPTNSTSFTRFSTSFINLTRLKLHFTHDIGDEESDGLHINVKKFGKIWEAWLNLTTLHITWEVEDLDLDLDSLISGIPRPRLENLRCEHRPAALHHNSLDCLRTSVDLEKSRPGISNLKQLQDLSIIVDGSKQPQLTDMGVYFGLAFANPNLQRAVINGLEENLVSEPCLRFIRKVFASPALIIL